MKTNFNIVYEQFIIETKLQQLAHDALEKIRHTKTNKETSEGIMSIIRTFVRDAKQISGVNNKNIAGILRSKFKLSLDTIDLFVNNS